MITSSYNIVFRLQVSHTYFQDGICKCLMYHPKAATKKIMKRFGFILKITNDGFAFYINTNKSISEVLNYIKRISDYSSFDFSLETTDSNFYNFTELPIDRSISLIYDSHSEKNISVSDNVILVPIDSEEYSSNAIGSVRIHFNDILNIHKVKSVTDFQIKFESRATQWAYHIINTTKRNFDDLSIQGRSGIQFNGPSMVTTPNNEPAFLFASDQSIALHETPKHVFNLIQVLKTSATEKNKTMMSQKIFSGLPNPSPNNLGITKQSNKKVISSPMYVYI